VVRGVVGLGLVVGDAHADDVVRAEVAAEGVRDAVGVVLDQVGGRGDEDDEPPVGGDVGALGEVVGLAAGRVDVDAGGLAREHASHEHLQVVDEGDELAVARDVRVRRLLIASVGRVLQRDDLARVRGPVVAEDVGGAVAVGDARDQVRRVGLVDDEASVDRDVDGDVVVRVRADVRDAVGPIGPGRHVRDQRQITGVEVPQVDVAEPVQVRGEQRLVARERRPVAVGGDGADVGVGRGSAGRFLGDPGDGAGGRRYRGGEGEEREEDSGSPSGRAHAASVSEDARARPPHCMRRTPTSSR
jgi:hypothetical protein